MDREEEIIQLLREIKDAQIKHHTEWQEAVQHHQQQAFRDIAKAKRKLSLFLIIFLVIVFIIYCVTTWLPFNRYMQSFPSLEGYDNPVDTMAFDGKYELNAEKSFVSLDSEALQVTPEDRATLKKMFAEQFENFRINKGIIRSGKNIIQEFRITQATINNDVLEGKAIWHEDVHDPGDCCVMNVRLALDGDELEFSFYAEGEEASEKIFLRKIG